MDLNASTRSRARSATAEPGYPPIELEGHSARFVRFHKAFRHAYKQATEKWTEEDLKAAFPKLYKKNPELFQNIRQLAIEQGRTHVEANERQLHASYNTGDAMDRLHKVITEAKERARKAEEEGSEVPESSSSSSEAKNTWNATLDPRMVSKAQVPLMRAEIERLKKQIAEIEARDEVLEAELRENITAHETTVQEIRGLISNVRDTTEHLAYNIQPEEFVQWALEVDETREAF
ncbi:hypothetical protein DL93DRAFT_2165882 [Clavulina sp. PMI_390]|nr:hypothetical protein DL93DRAFT_2165882 [Clavulina sp. PMI_390]